MIKIFPIVFPSALYFWTNQDFIHGNSNLLPANRKLVSLPEHYELLNDKSAIQQILNKYQIPAPVQVFAPKDGVRKESRWMSSFVYPAKMPPKAFVEMESILILDGQGGNCRCQILIASPEYCFLQMAAKRPFLETIRFGYDLCCTYKLDDTAEYGQVKRTPPVNTKLLQEFLRWMEGMYGFGAACKALKYVKDNSNSPAETRLAMMEILPFKYGGFHIDGHELNGDVYLSEHAGAIFRYNKCCCDAVWRNEKVALEYDSNKTHLSVKQHDKDNRKVTALSADGFKVLAVTNEMVSSLQEIENTFVLLRGMLGKRTDMNRIAATRTERRKLIKFLKQKSWWERD